MYIETTILAALKSVSNSMCDESNLKEAVLLRLRGWKFSDQQFSDALSHLITQRLIGRHVKSTTGKSSYFSM